MAVTRSDENKPRSNKLRRGRIHFFNPMPLIAILLMIWLTVVRHEGAHAFAAWLEGVPVHRIRLLPGYDAELGFYFGYVSRAEGGSWLIDAAPFVAAVIWFLAGYILLRRLPRSSRWWVPIFFIAAVSPLADLVYNYQGGLWREQTDVWDLFRVLPAWLVHGFYLGAILMGVLGIVRLRSARASLEAG